MPNVPDDQQPLASGTEDAQASSVTEVPKARLFGPSVCSHIIPVIIEDYADDGVHWLLSFNGSNPEPEFVVEMKSKEDAYRAHELITKGAPNLA